MNNEELNVKLKDNKCEIVFNCTEQVGSRDCLYHSNKGVCKYMNEFSGLKLCGFTNAHFSKIALYGYGKAGRNPNGYNKYHKSKFD